jgi:hypothetical protein
VLAATSVPAPVQAWEPTKPVEFIVPAGTGGGADQMARFVQGVAAKHNLMKSRWWSSTSRAEPAPKASWKSRQPTRTRIRS